MKTFKTFLTEIIGLRDPHNIDHKPLSFGWRDPHDIDHKSLSSDKIHNLIDSNYFNAKDIEILGSLNMLNQSHLDKLITHPDEGIVHAVVTGSGHNLNQNHISKLLDTADPVSKFKLLGRAKLNSDNITKALKKPEIALTTANTQLPNFEEKHFKQFLHDKNNGMTTDYYGNVIDGSRSHIIKQYVQKYPYDALNHVDKEISTAAINHLNSNINTDNYSHPHQTNHVVFGKYVNR